MKKFLSLFLLSLLAFPVQIASATTDIDDLDLNDFMFFEDGETWSYAYLTHYASDYFLDLIDYEAPEGDEDGEPNPITLDEETDWEESFTTYTMTSDVCHVSDACFTLTYRATDGNTFSEYEFLVKDDELVFYKVDGDMINETFFSTDARSFDGLTVFSYMMASPILQFYPIESVQEMYFDTTCFTEYYENESLWGNLDGYNGDLLAQECEVMIYDEDGEVLYEVQAYDYYVKDFGHYHTSYFIYDKERELLLSMSEMLYDTSLDLDEVLDSSERNGGKSTVFIDEDLSEDDFENLGSDEEEVEEEELEESTDEEVELTEEETTTEDDEETTLIENPFADLKVSHQNYEAILWLNEWGVISGYEDGTVAPNTSINRAELIKVLVESKVGTPAEELYQSCFTDVNDEWFAKYVCYAAEQGWVSGYEDGSFQPANTVLDVEAIKMLLEVYEVEVEESETMPYSDVSTDEWYASYLYTAHSMGILEQEDEHYNPGTEQTRANVFENLYRLILL